MPRQIILPIVLSDGTLIRTVFSIEADPITVAGLDRQQQAEYLRLVDHVRNHNLTIHSNI